MLITISKLLFLSLTYCKVLFKVYKVNNNGARAMPRGAPVLITV